MDKETAQREAQSCLNPLMQIVLAFGTSYLAAKLDNQQTSWIPYRQQMLAGIGQAGMQIAAQHAAAILQPQPQKGE